MAALCKNFFAPSSLCGLLRCVSHLTRSSNPPNSSRSETQRKPTHTPLIDTRFVWLKINWSPDNKNEAMLSRWPKIKGYPHLFVLDAKGQLLHSQDTGTLESGDSYDVVRFTAFLRQAH